MPVFPLFQLSMVGRDALVIPPDLGITYGPNILRLDLCFNRLRQVESQYLFHNDCRCFNTGFLSQLTFILFSRFISSDLEGIQGFTELRELILDGNEIDDDVIFPVLEYVHTLTMNKNKVSLKQQA